MSARQRRWLISSKKELHLDSRRLGNLEAREIAEELASDNDTHDLWLGRNHISDEGVTALAWALERNSSLKKLGLSENQFGDEAIISLASALQKNASLEKLWLHYNPKVSDVGGRALRDMLLVNPALIVCDVDSTGITDPSIKYDILELSKMSEERRQAALTGRMLPLPSVVNPSGVSSPRGTVSFRLNPGQAPPAATRGHASPSYFSSERSASYVPSFLQDTRANRAVSAPAPVIVAPRPSPIAKPPSPAPTPAVVASIHRPPSPSASLNALNSTASPFVPTVIAPSPTKPSPNPFYNSSTPFFFPQPSSNAPSPIKPPSSLPVTATAAPSPSGGPNLQLITAPQRISMLETELERYKTELETRESQLEVLAAENRALLEENARLRMEHKAQEHEIERLSRENLFLHGESIRNGRSASHSANGFGMNMAMNGRKGMP